ncbi:MAG: NYN domain-containing protein [Planctomycetaceae bacterium]|nr:NYN domain-containing protein [Planctomycetaceae bacterium]
MALIIDGYNLIHGANLIGGGVGPRGLERSRQVLLDFLVASLPPDELSHTTVVFDAAKPPPGRPRRSEYQGIVVLFASAYDNADELIEELIQADSAPKRLTVVSSDHRLHKAARRRKAKAIDSDRWYAEIVKKRTAQRSQRPLPDKPTGPLAPHEVERWLQELGALPAGERAEDTDWPQMENPFPPGYGEELDGEQG